MAEMKNLFTVPMPAQVLLALLCQHNIFRSMIKPDLKAQQVAQMPQNVKTHIIRFAQYYLRQKMWAWALVRFNKNALWKLNNEIGSINHFFARLLPQLLFIMQQQHTRVRQSQNTPLRFSAMRRWIFVFFFWKISISFSPVKVWCRMLFVRIIFSWRKFSSK